MCRCCIHFSQLISTCFIDSLCSRRQFTLVRIINAVMRIDKARGNRYLLELEVKDGKDQVLRLSNYVFNPIHSSEPENKNSTSHKLPLCNPVGFRWNPDATVHFIIPGTLTFIPAHFFLVLGCASFFVLASVSTFAIHKNIHHQGTQVFTFRHKTILVKATGCHSHF